MVVRIGILNLNSNSFSDPGLRSLDQVLDNALSFVNVQYLDIGAQTTQPMALELSSQDEIALILPFLDLYPNNNLSLDSYKPEVVSNVFTRDADKFAFLNDVSGLQNPKMLTVVAEEVPEHVRIICMHNGNGVPPIKPSSQIPDGYYDSEGGLLEAFKKFWYKSISLCSEYGIDSSRLILDPGLGFGKNLNQSLEILSLISAIKQEFGLPVLVGASRKSFLRAWKQNQSPSILDLDSWTQDYNALAINAGADFLRVHV